MRLSEHERTAAQADLDRLTGELVRLYQLREQLKLALNDGDVENTAIAVGESELHDELPPIRVVRGSLIGTPERDEAQRQSVRAKLQIIRGGLS